MRVFLLDVTPSGVAAVVRQTSQSPRGRAVARAIALRELPIDELIRKTLVAYFVESIRQFVIKGDFSPGQEAVFVKLGEDAVGAYFSGKVGQPQLLQLALTWRGMANLAGWAGVAPSLEPSLRGPLAYMFGLRFLQLKHKTEAISFFRAAMADAPKGSTLQQLARAELDRLTPKDNAPQPKP